MRNKFIHGLAAIGFIGLGVVWTCRAAANHAWAERDAVAAKLRVLEVDLRLCGQAIAACREGVAARREKDLAGARQALAEAEKAAERAHTEAGLDEARDKLENARRARGDKTDTLVADAPAFRAAMEQRALVRRQIELLEAKISSLKADEFLELARLRTEERDLSRRIQGARRSLWRRGEVTPLSREVEQAEKEYQAKLGKAAGWKAADEKVKAARKQLDAAIAALPLDGPAVATLSARQAELEQQRAEAVATLVKLGKSFLDGAKNIAITAKVYDRAAKAEVDRKISLWLPPHHPYIGGIVVAHPMIQGLATSRPMQLAAARAGLGLMVHEHFPSGGKESLAHLDSLFEKFAAESGHPELRGAPVLLGGLSASVLGTRNVACAVPERVFGIVHAAGGNLQEMPDDGRGMVHVPFLAINGEFEWCGPVGGGKNGIRPEYGLQTQWVMIREQMLLLWRDKHEHRMSLVVVPNADHGAWDIELAALFVRKAAQYRLPKQKRDGSRPAVCAPLPVNQGWLTDADLDHPQFEPAPYHAYKGDKNNAFWHFDEEMARAVYDFHKGKFILPDPTKTSPVPADWPHGQ